MHDVDEPRDLVVSRLEAPAAAPPAETVLTRLWNLEQEREARERHLTDLQRQVTKLAEDALQRDTDLMDRIVALEEEVQHLTARAAALEGTVGDPKGAPAVRVLLPHEPELAERVRLAGGSGEVADAIVSDPALRKAERKFGGEKS